MSTCPEQEGEGSEEDISAFEWPEWGATINNKKNCLMQGSEV